MLSTWICCPILVEILVIFHDIIDAGSDVIFTNVVTWAKSIFELPSQYFQGFWLSQKHWPHELRRQTSKEN